MISTLGHLCRALAVAFLLLAAPASMAAEAAPPGAEIAKAQAALKGGQPDEALAILRPLARSHPTHTGIQFLTALAALETSRMADVADTDREALLDEAIATLRAILVDHPTLLRVRLELARTFFHKGEDSLARDHFERVLAGKPPPRVVSNINFFLGQIRARRRWSMYFGVSLAPDTNINAQSDEEFIHIDIFNTGTPLPFRRNNAGDTVSSGVGASVWTGGEYQHPLGSRLRLRAGADLSRTEYSGREFDTTTLSLHAGPRWLIDARTDLSLLASARRHWAGTHIDHDAIGGRIEAQRRLTPRVTAYTRTSWHKRDYRDSDSQNGPVVDASLGGTWTIAPILRADGTIGYGKERPMQLRNRNDSRWIRAGLSVILPHGFNVSGNGRIRWTGYKGAFPPFTRPDVSREDRTRSLSLSVHKRDLTLFGFSPQVVMTRELRDSNAQLHDYQRTRGELRFVRQF